MLATKLSSVYCLVEGQFPLIIRSHELHDKETPFLPVYSRSIWPFALYCPISVFSMSFQLDLSHLIPCLLLPSDLFLRLQKAAKAVNRLFRSDVEFFGSNLYALP